VVPNERAADELRTWLAELGYGVVFRNDVWVDCLISRDAERWIGRGTTEADAIDQAVRAMFPSHAARMLFERSQRDRQMADATPPEELKSSDSAAEMPAVSPDVLGDPAEEPTVEVTVPVMPPPAPVAPSPNRATVIAPPPAARPAHVPKTMVASVADQVLNIPKRKARAISTKTVEIAIVPPMLPDEALAEVSLIEELIDAKRPELALMTPERQRLALLAWICHARAIQAGSGNDRAVVDAVTAIARRLTVFSKRWWPGSVTALQLDATPRDVGRELDLPTITRPRSWSQAAEAAENKLRFVEERDERHQRDEYGWADAAYLAPAPINAEAYMLELRRQIEQVAGKLDQKPPPRLDPATRRASKDDRARYLQWIRRARWMRGYTTDFVTWGNMMGRLRWFVSQLDTRDDALESALSGDHHPKRSWAAALGQDPDAKRKQRLKRTVLRQRPWVGQQADADAVIGWLVDAFKVLESERIAKLIAPMREVVANLGPDDIPDANRNKRRRLRQVQEHLLTVGDDVLDDEFSSSELEIPVAIEPDFKEVQKPAVDPHEELLSRVRPATRGKRALFVSNRTDPDLEAAIGAAFQFAELDWCEGSPRRVQTVAERVTKGTYDMVLGATGFQSHSMDTHLFRACRRARIPYVRVHRGRTLACTLALARELGIAH